MINIINISEAILKINPNAKTIVVGHLIDDCTIQWIDTAEIPKADIKTKMAELKNELINAAAKKATDKASGNAKLKALGLTEDEIEAIKS